MVPAAGQRRIWKTAARGALYSVLPGHYLPSCVRGIDCRPMQGMDGFEPSIPPHLQPPGLRRGALQRSQDADSMALAHSHAAVLHHLALLQVRAALSPCMAQQLRLACLLAVSVCVRDICEAGMRRGPGAAEESCTCIHFWPCSGP